MKTFLTEYELIDKYLGGLNRGEVTLIGGRPQMGKTSLALQIALNVARQGTKVVYFSAEASSVELELRIISFISGIPYVKICKWDLTDEEWELFKSAAKEVKDLPISFHYCGDLMYVKYWWEHERPDTKLIIYDYYQVIHKNPTQLKGSTPNLTPVEYLIEIKKIAKRFKNPVIVLTQLSGKLERRKDKRPKIEDIRIKKLSETAYDQAILLYRDVYYESEAPRDKAELIGVCRTKQIEKTCNVSWNWDKGGFEEIQ